MLVEGLATRAETDDRPWRSLASTVAPRAANGFQPARAGLVIVDRALKPIHHNEEAVQILAYPKLPEEIDSPQTFLETRIRSVLVDNPYIHAPTFVREFQSGRRRYVCRTFPLDSVGPAGSCSATAVLLERDQQRLFDPSQVATYFRLSQRERETIELLVYGLTSKEIAHRMNISPSTVKAFLRMAMVKMGVSTRSGLVGRILEVRAAAGA